MVKISRGARSPKRELRKTLNRVVFEADDLPESEKRTLYDLIKDKDNCPVKSAQLILSEWKSILSPQEIHTILAALREVREHTQ